MKQLVKNELAVFTIVVSINVIMFMFAIVYDNGAFAGALIPIDLMICAVLSKVD